jgi:hypothetical protein
MHPPSYSNAPQFELTSTDPEDTSLRSGACDMTTEQAENEIACTPPEVFMSCSIPALRLLTGWKISKIASRARTSYASFLSLIDFRNSELNCQLTVIVGLRMYSTPIKSVDWLDDASGYSHYRPHSIE